MQIGRDRECLGKINERYGQECRGCLCVTLCALLVTVGQFEPKWDMVERLKGRAADEMS